MLSACPRIGVWMGYGHGQDDSLNSSERYVRESDVAPRGTIGLNTGFRMYAQLCY